MSVGQGHKTVGIMETANYTSLKGEGPLLMDIKTCLIPN